MNALEERRERVAYAKSIGVDKPHTMKRDALEDAIRVAEEARKTDTVEDPTDPTTPDDDPFDEIDPAVEGDHHEEPTIADKVAERDATREAWLLAAVEELRPLLKQAGAVVPSNIAVSVGFPSRNARKTLGVCFPTTATDNAAVSHMFISPIIEDAVEVLGVLAHELIHASDNCASKHGGHFKTVATALGLTGKMTATTIGPELRDTLTDISSELGKYPHVKINLSGIKKQTTRLLKGVCSDGECPLADEKGKRYTIRLTQKWVEVGMPSCPCGAEMQLEDD